MSLEKDEQERAHLHSEKESCGKGCTAKVDVDDDAEYVRAVEVDDDAEDHGVITQDDNKVRFKHAVPFCQPPPPPPP